MYIETESLIDHNPSLQSYYGALESRIGYRLFLGGTRHFGYYPPGTKWPFPINGALRRMEDHLFASLQLQPGSKVLDAGCGVGHVALRFAQKGLYVQGIDVVENHVRWARQNIQAYRLQEAVSVRLMDYHHLDGLTDESFDGVYTLETFVHATDPEKALGEFFRVLKPGGSIAMYEYDHPETFSSSSGHVSDPLFGKVEQINQVASMPSNRIFSEGTLRRMLEEQGFQDVVVQDLTENIRPMARLFFFVAYIPYILFCLLGIEVWFVNTMAGVEGYRCLKKGFQRFVAVRARKPSDKALSDSGLRQRLGNDCTTF